MAFDHDELMDCMTRIKGENQPFAVATVVRTQDSTAGKPGDKMVIRADGRVTGFVGGGCTLGAVKKAAMAALADGQPRLIRVRPKDEMATDAPPDGMELHGSNCPSRGLTELFIEPVLPRARLLVLGTSPVARTLAALAKTMGHVVAVAGPAEELAEMADVDRAIEGFELGEAAEGFHHVVVATQGRGDKNALRAALQSGADYVGFVGSRKKARKLINDLAEEGVAAERLAVVRSPAGLHIGAVTPDEIALSVLAEIIHERRRGPIERDEASPPVATADDRLEIGDPH